VVELLYIAAPKQNISSRISILAGQGLAIDPHEAFALLCFCQFRQLPCFKQHEEFLPAELKRFDFS
jgi:hypothetical protein